MTNIQKDIPTTEEFNRILECAKSYRTSSYLLFKLLSLTGRRLGEFVGVLDPDTKEWMLGMKVSDVYPEENKLLLYIIKPKRKKKSGEINKQRYKKQTNFIPSDVMGELVAFIKENNLGMDDTMFRGKHTPTYRTYQRDFTKCKNMAHISRENVTIHSLRHYFVTLMRMKFNMPYEDIAERYTHHKNLNVLKDFYSHVDMEKLKPQIMEDMKKLNNMLNRDEHK